MNEEPRALPPREGEPLELRTPEYSSPARPAHAKDKTTMLLLIALIAVLLAAMVQQVYLHNKREPKTLLDYPQQRLHAERYQGHWIVVINPSGPTILEVEATKCNLSKDPIDVVGSSSWVSTEPPGSLVPGGEGAGARPPGCKTKVYENEIPAAVIQRTKEILQSDSERSYVTWRYTGHETPDDPHVRTESWTTEEFDLYVKPPTGHLGD